MDATLREIDAVNYLLAVCLDLIRDTLVKRRVALKLK